MPSQNIGADFLMAVGMSLKFGSSSQIANLFGIYWWRIVREGQKVKWIFQAGGLGPEL